MKKLCRTKTGFKVAFILFLTVFLQVANAQWSPVGGNLGFASETSPSISLDTTANVPYVAYADGAINAFVVQKFQNNAWTQVGPNLGFASQASPALVFNPATNEPYIAYADGSVNSYVVQRFTNGAWTQVGSNQGFTSNGFPSLAFDPATNEPYIAYADGAANAFVVKKFSGNDWVQVGSNLGFASQTSPSLTFNPVMEEPYIAYADGAVNSFVIQKFTNGVWTQVGQNQGFASEAAPSLKFSKASSIPYVIYPDGSTHSYMIKKFIDNGWVQVGDNRGFATGGSPMMDAIPPPSIVFNRTSNEPYIAYPDGAVHAYITEKFTNDQWVQVGSLGFASFSSPSITFNNEGSELYIAYADGAANAIQVQKTSTGVTLPIAFTDVNAVIKNNAAQISWKVVNEQGIKEYQVERSTDGHSFTKIHTIAGNTTATNINTYVWVDATPLQGANYYRIKSIDMSGQPNYTSIVRLKFGKLNGTFAVFPNPVYGSYFNVSISNQPSGNYTLQLVNGAGQVIYSSLINHNGGSTIERISIPKKIERGVFRLQISTEGYKDVRNLIISSK